MKNGSVILFISAVLTLVFAHDVLGEKIVFSSDRDGNSEIYVMDANGTNQTRLTNNAATDFQPSFSADGSKIVFASLRDGNSQIYIMDANGSNQVRLSNNAAEEFDPSFSLDSNRIVFVSTRDDDDEIYVMNSDGTNQLRLTTRLGFFDTQPSFSPDGSRILFYSCVYGVGSSCELYLMNANGSSLGPLTNNSVSDSQPAFSASGDSIVFVSDRDGNNEIYSMNSDGTNQINLTENPDDDLQPAFSPSGGQIAFRSNRDGNMEIYRMAADGTSQTNLTNSPASDRQPSWDSTSEDTTAPLFDPISNIVVFLPAPTMAATTIVNFPTPTASDNSGCQVLVTTSPASGSPFPLGSTAVLAEATDNSGNTARTSFTVTVLEGGRLKRESGLNLVNAEGNSHLSLSSIKGPNFYVTTEASRRIGCLVR